MKQYFTWIILAIQLAHLQTNAEWTYGGEGGPKQWSESFQQCNGVRQSPVHIHEQWVQHDRHLGTFFFGGHENINRLKATMINSGKAVQVELSGAQFIEDGGLMGRYKAVQFHFHWGKDSSRGSEHVLNRRRYPMELHIVHFKEEYGNLTNAIRKPDGLAVLSLLFETTDIENEQFDALASHLPNIREPGQSIEIDEFCLKTIFPMEMKKFYRYRGSLTTPPCQESVIWTIFTDTVKISTRQMNLFRHLKRSPVGSPHTPSVQESRNAEFVEDIYLTDNFRPLQELNGRAVYSSFDPHAPEVSSSQNLLANVVCLLLAVGLGLVLRW